MVMTKEQFKAIAGILKIYYKKVKCGGLIKDFIKYLKTQNVNFDEFKFRKYIKEG